MNDTRPRWLAVAAAATRAARAIAVDPGCEPRRAAGHLVDAWAALTLATWPDIGELSDLELEEHAGLLPAHAGWRPQDRGRVRAGPRHALAERRRGRWDDEPFPRTRAEVEAQVVDLERLIAATRGPGPRARPLLRGLGLTLGLACAGLLALRPWQSPDFGPWRATYFTRHDLSGATLERHDLDINFEWGRAAPADAIPADRFSARWDSCLTLDRPGKVAFQLTSDEGARLFIDGKLVINDWQKHPLQARGGVLRLPAGVHHVRVEYYEITRDATVILNASLGGEPPAPIPASVLRAPAGPFDAPRPCDAAP